MARIRSVKPEFWEDEAIAILSRDARLLFIATWNMADDEGLLRWTPEYVKAQVFMYDEDIDTDATQRLMDEITGSGLILAYKGGKLQQRLGWIVNFHKHQKPNRPQPSKLPPPSLQNRDVVRAYAERDGWACHLCGETVESDPAAVKDKARKVSLDHLTPRGKGGSDYPGNIKIAHSDCNSGKRDRHTDSFHPGELTGSVNGAVNSSVNDASPEGRGGERRGEEQPSAVADEVDDGFEAFWDAYPRHHDTKAKGGGGSKATAKKRWRKLSATERAEVEAAVVPYAKLCGPGGQKPKHAERFLINDAWHPYLPSARGSPGMSTVRSSAEDTFGTPEYEARMARERAAREALAG